MIGFPFFNKKIKQSDFIQTDSVSLLNWFIVFCYLRGRKEVSNTVVVIKKCNNPIHKNKGLCVILHLAKAEYCTFSYFLTNC